MSAPASVDDMLRIVKGVDVNAHTTIGWSASVLSYFPPPLSSYPQCVAYVAECFLLDSCCSNYSAPRVSI